LCARQGGDGASAAETASGAAFHAAPKQRTMSALLIVGTGLGLMRTRIESPCRVWHTDYVR